MTIFGPDISSYEAGLALARLVEASFVLAKTTEGTYYTDADYQGWRQQAADLGKPFVWYHFLSGEDAHAQAQHTAANVGDIGLPGMLDAEPAGSFSPSLAQMIAYVDAAHGAGLKMRLIYLPRWYWQQIGSPGLGPLADRGLSLVSSSYPGGAGTPSRLYPGDGAAGWQAYGGMAPELYQYTNQATDGGKNEDYNAFRGTVAELQQLLNGGADVALTSEDIAAVAKAVYEYSEETINLGGKPYHASLGQLAHGAWVATNDPSGPLLTAIAAVSGRLDPNAIGAAVAAHLSGGGGASAADIAAAVEHLFAQKLSA